MRRLTVGILLLAAGCANPSQPELSLDWSTRPIMLEQRTTPPQVVVVGGAGEVTVRGDTDLRACYTLERRAAVRGSTLTFALQHQRTSQRTCPGVAEYVAYEAVIRGVDPGRYTVRVEYANDARVAGNPVVEQEVVVR
jgi:hypothetical protein